MLRLLAFLLLLPSLAYAQHNPGVTVNGTVTAGHVATFTNNWSIQDGGAPGVGTVTTTGSPASGNLTKFSGAASVTNADLSGDVTTSGTLATTVVKVDGVAYAASPSTDTVPVITASNTATYTSMPNCLDSAGQHINYTTSTHLWSCGTSSSASGTVTSVATTAPITGGTISTTGTIACATCVTASSPGVGLAHFAGSTQAVTSSAVALGGADVSGTLAATNGGTGQATWTQGDIMYSSASNTLSKLSAGTQGQVLSTGGSAANPAWVDGTGIAKNYILNGDMLIDQVFEGAAATCNTATTNGLYGPDQWEWVCNDVHIATVTTQRVLDAPAATQLALSTKIKAATGSGTIGSGEYVILVQPLEGASVLDLNIGNAQAATISVSFWVKAHETGNFAFLLANNVDTRGWCQMNAYSVADTWQHYTINGITLDTTGTWQNGTGAVGMYVHLVAVSGSGTQSASCGSGWIASAPLGNNTQSNFLSANNDTFQVTGFKLAVEPKASAFVVNPLPLELDQARRYYKKSFPQGVAVGQNKGVAGSTCVKNPIALGDPSSYINYAVMALSPTFTTYNPSVTNANWRDVTAASDATVSVDPATAKSDTGILIATSGTVTTLGDVLCIQWSADGRLDAHQ